MYKFNQTEGQLLSKRFKFIKFLSQNTTKLLGFQIYKKNIATLPYSCELCVTNLQKFPK